MANRVSIELIDDDASESLMRGSRAYVRPSSSEGAWASAPDVGLRRTATGNRSRCLLNGWLRPEDGIRSLLSAIGHRMGLLVRQLSAGTWTRNGSLRFTSIRRRCPQQSGHSADSFVSRRLTEADSDTSVTLPAICCVKRDIARSLRVTVADAMTVCGGIASRDRSLFDRLLRDTQAAAVMAPASDVRWTWAGGVRSGKPIPEG